MRLLLRYVMYMALGALASCDAELLEPSGYGRRLVRELDFEGMVRTEYRYLKNDRVGKIISYQRIEMTGDHTEAGAATVSQGNPYIYDFEYDGKQPVRAVVERSPVCGCGLPFNEVWTYTGSLDNGCIIEVERRFSGSDSPPVSRMSYRVEWTAHLKRMEIIPEYDGVLGGRYVFIFDESLHNVVERRDYIDGEISSVVTYSYDDKINPFYRLNHVNIFSPSYWSRNNVLVMNDKTMPQYVKNYYTYYDQYPISYRIEILNHDYSGDWLMLYEYE